MCYLIIASDSGLQFVEFTSYDKAKSAENNVNQIFNDETTPLSCNWFATKVIEK